MEGPPPSPMVRSVGVRSVGLEIRNCRLRGVPSACCGFLSFLPRKAGDPAIQRSSELSAAGGCGQLLEVSPCLRWEAHAGPGVAAAWGSSGSSVWGPHPRLLVPDIVASCKPPSPTILQPSHCSLSRCAPVPAGTPHIHSLCRHATSSALMCFIDELTPDGWVVGGWLASKSEQAVEYTIYFWGQFLHPLLLGSLLSGTYF